MSSDANPSNMSEDTRSDVNLVQESVTLAEPSPPLRKRKSKRKKEKIELNVAGEKPVSPPPHHHHRVHRKPGERKDFHQKLWKTPKETLVAVTMAASKKATIPIDKLAILGFVSGVYVAFGGLFALTVSLGCPNCDPGIQKLLTGLTFPIALYFIVFLGGELFTGNIMYSTAGYMAGTITPKKIVVICVVAFFSNWAGTVAAAYFFGYLTEVYAHDPWLSGIQAIAVKKTSMGFGNIFLRGVAANWLVNIAIFIMISAEDITGKTLGMFFPICAFATVGYEHCIANMFYVDLGLMYGADTTFGRFIYKNLIPSTLGNILGGGFFIGALNYYVYGWKVPKEDDPAIKNLLEKEMQRQKEHPLEITCLF